jgi:hypothetical protein
LVPEVTARLEILRNTLCLPKFLHIDFLNYNKGLTDIRHKAVCLSPVNKGKSKDKAFPAQAWTGPEGYKRLRLPDLKTVGT